MSGPCKRPAFPLAPSDAEAERVYDDVMRRAAAAGLVVHSYGGVATLAVPCEQRKAGVRDQVLEAIERSDTPPAPGIPAPKRARR